MEGRRCGDVICGRRGWVCYGGEGALIRERGERERESAQCTGGPLRERLPQSDWQGKLEWLNIMSFDNEWSSKTGFRCPHRGGCWAQQLLQCSCGEGGQTERSVDSLGCTGRQSSPFMEWICKRWHSLPGDKIACRLHGTPCIGAETPAEGGQLDHLLFAALYSKPQASVHWSNCPSAPAPN